MKAAILEKIGAPLTIADIQSPEPGFGQVLIKVLCAGICGSQLQEIDGTKGNPEHLPHLLGHEGCGIVERVGYGVRNVKARDKVVLHWRKGDGCESELPVYPRRSNGVEPIRAGAVTTFSEFAIVSENRVTKVPDDLPNDLAALLGCALSTALATVENEARIKFGETAVIIGCGGVGLCSILAARLARASIIGAVDLEDSKRVLAMQIGADAFDYFPGPEIAADVIIDTTSKGEFFSSLKPSGSYILVGQRNGTMEVVYASHLFQGEGKTIKATQGGGFNPTRDIPRYANLWRSGALHNYVKIITHRISLDQINEGIRLVRDGKAGRVMIDMK